MVGEALAGLSAFKTMFDMAKGLKDINDAAVRNAAVIELQEKILSTQAEQALLIQRVGQLEARVAEFEAWDADKQRYQLKKLPPGIFVYTLKPEMAGGEPTHHICQTCYQHNKKSILHVLNSVSGQEQLHCHECSFDVWSGVFRPEQIDYPPSD